MISPVQKIGLSLACVGLATFATITILSWGICPM